MAQTRHWRVIWWSNTLDTWEWRLFATKREAEHFFNTSTEHHMTLEDRHGPLPAHSRLR